MHDSALFMYNLQSINLESPDIFSALKKYSNNNYKTDRKIKLYNKDEIKPIISIPMNYIIECLCGIEELREETKCYI